ncbi:EF-P 5-aminopentanol modification-associated protein YfmF [Streptococcus sobrinus]|uniref:Peptidase M16 inactive domain protein n=1 Tax=Streptococcus sobrinus W1703 TaxID=1227275 RepID=U2KH88_9STRE|nr:pitrilysin family protein [Streptococcus sobrinus]ERJ76524.1 peptidase M16 inactive domain protein [Streptococcus sobrinus W1703]
MKIVDGVNLHLIKTEKFKTNHLTFRFTGERLKKTVAKRVLVAQMLATANADFPSSQKLRKTLARLYGTSLSTRVSTKGKAHILDIDLEFISPAYLEKTDFQHEIFDLLYTILYKPLITLEQFQSKVFDVEKANLISYLEADKEDSFYLSELGLYDLFYHDDNLKVSKYARVDLVEQENSFTAYQEFQRMLKEDQIDIFLLGDFEASSVLEEINRFPFQARKLYRFVNFTQDRLNITQEKIDRQDDHQSILQLGYHLPLTYSHPDYPIALVLNGLLGGFAHSRLFTQVREKEGLAYSISSQVHPYTVLLQVYAGIDKRQREKTLRMINQEWHNLKAGRYSSHLLQQTKQHLLNDYYLAQDSPKILIERAYNQKYLAKNDENLPKWPDRIAAVNKADIMQLARKIHLQALYYLEGGK